MAGRRRRGKGQTKYRKTGGKWPIQKYIILLPVFSDRRIFDCPSIPRKLFPQLALISSWPVALFVNGIIIRIENSYSKLTKLQADLDQGMNLRFGFVNASVQVPSSD